MKKAKWSGLTDEMILASARSRQCGARTKTNGGQPCKLWRFTFLCKNGKWRCKLHGGKSVGPRTQQGKARVTLNMPNVVRARARASIAKSKPQDTRVSAC